MTLWQPSSVILSPLNFFILLSMLSYGAQREEKNLFLAAVGLRKNETRIAKYGYKRLINKLSHYNMRISIKVYYAADSILVPFFTRVAKKVFKADIEPVDAGNEYISSEKINDWVKNQTNNECTYLFKEPHGRRQVTAIIKDFNECQSKDLFNSTLRNVNLYLPKFKFEYSELLFSYIGDAHPFKTQSTFSIMMAGNESMSFGNGVVKYVIEVDEDGDKSAGLTGAFYTKNEAESVHRNVQSIEPNPTFIEFHVNHSFIAIIATRGEVFLDLFTVICNGLSINTFDPEDRIMKVEGVVAPILVPHKIKVKEEAKECCGYQQITTSAGSIAATTTISETTTSVSSISSVVSATTSSTSSSAIANIPIDSGTTSIIPTTISPTASAIVRSPTPVGIITNAPAVLSPSSTSSGTSGATGQTSGAICQVSPTAGNLVTMVNKSSELFPVDLDLKTKVPQVLPNGPSPSRERATRDESIETGSTRDSRLSPCTINKVKSQYQVNGSVAKSEYGRGTGGGGVVDGHLVSPGSSGNESPLSSHAIKPETEESPSTKQHQEDNQSNEGATIGNGVGSSGRSVTGIFSGHGKLKRLLGTLIQFASNISQDTGESVRTLILGLLSGAMTAEEFHSALQEATNFPLKGFVLPYLRHTLPSLRRDLTAAARANNQSCVQYFRTNESVILETVSLAPSSDAVDLFGDHSNGISSTNAGNHCTGSYGIMRSSSVVIGPPQHSSNSSNSSGTSLHPHYSNTPTNLATKRRASDVPYFENGVSLEDGPVYGKRSSLPWNHHSHQHQPQPPDSYCWYPLHSTAGTLQSSHSHGPSPVPPGLVQVNQLTSFGPPQLPHQQQQPPLGHIGGQMQNGSMSLDDEWKNIHVMLNCILGMVEKTKRALAILQRRGSPSPAATAPPLTPGAAVGAQNGASNGNNPSSSNSVPHVESSTGDRDAGNLKRLSGEIVAQTIRATEDRVAEVKRRAEEAVQEVKRAAVAEVQRAVAVAVAESRANERLRVHRLLDLPSPHRNHAALRQASSFIRVATHINPNNPEVAGRTGSGTPTTTSASVTSGSADDEKDVAHLASVVGSGCWNCGRTALETCGGCGVARYCGSFCQHRDWEAGGHHANCNSSPSRERPRRSSSQSPTRSAVNVASSNDPDSNAVAAPTAAK